MLKKTKTTITKKVENQPVLVREEEIRIRVSVFEKALFIAAASREGMTLSSWVRSAARAHEKGSTP